MDDIATLKTWSHAFEEHPIAGVRNVEKQLRVDLARTKDRLRTLVGGNYRNLLATAEQIVNLEEQVKSAEGQISHLSKICKPPEPASPNPFKSTIRSKQAQLSLLRKCTLGISVCLRHEALLLSAQVLVISRLLHKSLSEGSDVPQDLDSIRDEIAILRRKTLRRVDKVLVDPSSTSDALTEAVCAFCLATSASASDALRHFQHLRLDNIRQRVQADSEKPAAAQYAFKYYVESLQTTKRLLGRQIPDALARMQKQPLLRTVEIQKFEILNLDVLGRLLPAEIRDFTPYIKIAQLAKHEQRAALENWSKEAFGAFLEGLRQILSSNHSVADILKLRFDLLSLWLPTALSTPAHSTVFETLCKALNEHLRMTIEEQAKFLADFGKTMTAEKDGPAASSVWEPSLVTRPINKGAFRFLSQLQSRHLSTPDVLKSALASLEQWAQSVKSTQDQLHALRQIRWQDMIEEPDEEEEEQARSIITQLSQHDPGSYLAHLQSVLVKTTSEFQRNLMAFPHDSPAQALLLLRTIRSTTSLLQSSNIFLPGSLDLAPFTAIVPSLHSLLASEVLSRLASAVATRSKTQSAQPPIAINQIPSNLPSPTTFRAIYSLCNIMSDLGGVDIWTAPAVRAVKLQVKQNIFHTSEVPEDESEDDNDVSLRRVAQSEFDKSYWRSALAAAGTAEDVETNGEDNNDNDLVKKAASEYWARTKLLFGVLSVD